MWARIDLGQVGDRVEISVPDHEPQQAPVKDRYDAQGSLSTPMIAVSRAELRRVRACLLRDGDRLCFGMPAAVRPGT